MSYLLDAGFLYSLINKREGSHQVVTTTFLSIKGPIILPTVATTEVAYLVQRDMGAQSVAKFLDSLANSPFSLTEPTSSDFSRGAEIIRQYSDSNIDFVDSIIFAMSERLKITKILTVDQRHFRIFRPKHCSAFEILP